SKRRFTLTAGKGEIEVLEKDGIKLATKQFELTRGGKTTVKVTLQEVADARKPKVDPKTEPRPLGPVTRITFDELDASKGAVSGDVLAKYLEKFGIQISALTPGTQ